MKEKETQGKSMCTKTSFNKRDEERWEKKRKIKKKTEKGKKKRTKSPESGNFPVFTATVVQIQTAY